GDGLDAAGVPAPLQITRKVNLKALATEMRCRFHLGVRLGMGDEPARMELDRHAALSVAWLMRIPNSAGTRTRSSSSCSATARTDSRVASRSVTTNASNPPGTAASDGTTGVPTKRSLLHLASTTATMAMPCSSAQIVAISARSETPISATRFHPRACAAVSTDEQSARARRKNENDEDRYS